MKTFHINLISLMMMTLLACPVLAFKNHNTYIRLNKNQHMNVISNPSAAGDFEQQIVIPKNSVLRLKEIIKTSKNEYWILSPVEINNQVQNLNVEQEFWIIRPLDVQSEENNFANSKSSLSFLADFEANALEKQYNFLNFCNDCGKTLLSDNSNQFASKSVELIPKSLVPIIPDAKNWNPRCTKFIDETGRLGEWGQHLYESLRTDSFSTYFRTDVISDMPVMCSKIADVEVDESEQKMFWIYLVASMAMSESSCNPKIDVNGLFDEEKGEYRIASGLLQLHKGNTKSYGCKKIDTLNALDNLSCGITILEKQLSKEAQIFVKPGRTYWQVLHNNKSGKKVKRLMQPYTEMACGDSIS